MTHRVRPSAALQEDPVLVHSRKGESAFAYTARCPRLSFCARAVPLLSPGAMLRAIFSGLAVAAASSGPAGPAASCWHLALGSQAQSREKMRFVSAALRKSRAARSCRRSCLDSEIFRGRLARSCDSREPAVAGLTMERLTRSPRSSILRSLRRTCCRPESAPWPLTPPQSEIRRVLGPKSYVTERR